MTQEDYRRALEAATREYEELGARRQAIDKRLAELAQTIGTLSKLIGLTPTVPLGLTDAVRLIMRGGVPMTPIDVRDRLHAIGFDVSKYVNAHDARCRAGACVSQHRCRDRSGTSVVQRTAGHARRVDRHPRARAWRTRTARRLRPRLLHGGHGQMRRRNRPRRRLRSRRRAR